ncbi:MAG: hypothetical protein ABJB86_08705 [Bacteroidota bacterium]
MNKKILALFLVFTGIAATAQTGRTDGLPISIKVNTPITVAGGAVQLSGVSNTMDKDPGQVFIDIKKPDGTLDHANTRADKKTGAYLVKYTCKTQGKYVATAYASDKKNAAVANFSVSSMSSVTEQFKDFEKEKVNAVQTLENAVNAAVASAGTGDDASKAKEKIAALKTQITGFDKSTGDLNAAIGDVTQLIASQPEINEMVAPDLGSLASELEEKTADLKQAEKNLNESKNESDICQRFYQLGEACAAFSTVMNLASGGLKDIAKSIFIDKVWPMIEQKVASKFSSAEHFLFQQGGKAGLSATSGLDELSTNSFKAGAAGDLSQYVSQELFKKYCTEFKGPVTGTYEVETKNEGKTYMKYKLTYEGTMSVYGKTTTVKNAAAPKLSGYFEGNVTAMDFTDDVWAVEKKEDWDEIKYERIAAPVTPFNAVDKDPGFGAAARAALPGAFYFPLEAQMTQGKMIIKLLPALSGFSPAFQNCSVVVVRATKEPHNLDGAVFSYPIQGATFIITRTMHMPDDKPVVSLPMKTGGGTGTVIEQEFNRSESPDGDINVNFYMTLKLTNQ